MYEAVNMAKAYAATIMPISASLAPRSSAKFGMNRREADRARLERN
jgi:hypothetical protein